MSTKFTDEDRAWIRKRIAKASNDIGDVYLGSFITEKTGVFEEILDHMSGPFCHSVSYILPLREPSQSTLSPQDRSKIVRHLCRQLKTVYILN